MTPPTLSIAETSDGVNPPPQAQATMWNRIVELQPLIRKCAIKMACVYDEDAGDLEHDMTLALLDKARLHPDLLDRPSPYIFQTLKNWTHNVFRSRREALSLDDELAWFNPDDDLDCQERIEAVRFILEHLDDECRELVKAILDNDDLIRDSRKKRANRPRRNRINVSALAERMGKPKISVYRDVARLRSELALSLAFA